MSDTEKDELYRQILAEKKKKEEAALRKKVRTKIFFIGIVCSTLILILVANSLAWFNNVKTGSVQPVDVTVVNAMQFQITSYPSTDWGSSLDVSFYPLKPICGDGNSFFDPIYTEVLTQDASGALVYKNQVTAYAKLASFDETSVRALVKDFLVKTNINQTKLYISPDSYLTANIAASDSSSINSSSLNTGHIAAAMRAAIYMEIGGVDTLLCYWIPNYNGHLTLDTNGLPVVENYTIDEYGVVTYYDTWQTEGDEHDYESEYILVNTAGTIGSGGTATSTAITVTSTGYVKQGNVLYVWDLQKAYDDGMYIYDGIQTNTEYKMKLVIWVEGTDRECDNALLGGKMNLKMNFKQGE